MASMANDSRLSSPLSMPSRSPSPPCDYPSPSMTQPSGSRSHSKTRDSPPSIAEHEEMPPAKKRKLTEPKPRTTEYLDMSAFDQASDNTDILREEAKLQRLLKVLRQKQKIVVIAGAGISVSAGIPDFRSSTGLFTTLRSQHKLKASGKHLFDASVYKHDDSTSSFHEMVRKMSQMTRSAKPTVFHHMLATLAEEGRLLRLYSQNVDGIDTSLQPLATEVPLKSKGPWPKTVQLHGGLEKMVCTKCGKLSEFDAKLFDGPSPPSCPECEDTDRVRTQHAGKRSHGVGRLRPRMVLYNEFNPDEEAIGAVTTADLRSRPDAVIVVGTSLKVPGVRRIAREMCWVARGRRDGFAAWINQGPEPSGIDMQGCWDLVVKGDCDEIARQACLPSWDDKDVGEYCATTAQEMLAATSQAEVEVVIKSEIVHKAVETAQGMVTPTASPRRQSPLISNTGPKMKQPKLTILLNNKGQDRTIDEESKPVTVQKPAKRKYVRKNPTNKPRNTLTKTFTVSKAGKASSVKTKDLDVKPAPAPTVLLFPNLPRTPSKAHDERHMRLLSTAEADVRNNSDFLSKMRGEHGKTCGPLDREEATISPYDVLSPESSRHETISPKSTPKGMADLIDT